MTRDSILHSHMSSSEYHSLEKKKSLVLTGLQKGKGQEVFCSILSCLTLWF